MTLWNHMFPILWQRVRQAFAYFFACYLSKYEEQVRRLGNLHYKTYATSLWTSGEYVSVQSLSQCNLNGCCTALCLSGSAWSVVWSLILWNTTQCLQVCLVNMELTKCFPFAHGLIPKQLHTLSVKWGVLHFSSLSNCPINLIYTFRLITLLLNTECDQFRYEYLYYREVVYLRKQQGLIYTSPLFCVFKFSVKPLANHNSYFHYHYARQRSWFSSCRGASAEIVYKRVVISFLQSSFSMDMVWKNRIPYGLSWTMPKKRSVTRFYHAKKSIARTESNFLHN